MKHYLLTRSAYGPDVPLWQNRARLDLMRGVLCRSLAAQTERDVTWLVLIDPADPLLAERTEALESAGLPLLLRDAGPMERRSVHDRPKGPWRHHIDWSQAVMTTRIDDDDAFAPWALALFHRNGLEREAKRGRRIVWVLGTGYRITSGRIAYRKDPVAQFSSLYAPRRDRTTIMDVNHCSIARLGQVNDGSEEPGWLWLRHLATRSINSRAENYQNETMGAITDDIRARFPVDWSLIESLP